MTNIAHTALPTPVTVAQINGYITAAVHEYTNYKSSAMKSAANAYLVWYHGESVNAEPDMRTWLNEEIAKRNTDIDAHNKSVNNLKERAKLCADNTINEPLSDDHRAELIALHARKPSEWASAKKVRIEVRDGASNFTRIAKFVFRFEKPADASHVSRYAKVLEYIEQHKNDLNGNFTVDSIVDLINGAGGFDAAIDKVRNPEAANDDKVREAILTKIRETVDSTDSGKVEFRTRYQKGGYVYLLGRPDGDHVTLCGELNLNDNESAALLLKLDGNIIGSAERTVDFVARVISLGELVREGRDSNIIDTAGTGKKFKVARTYFIAEAGGKTQMAVSSRYTDASVVVHAIPKGDVEIGAVMPGQAAYYKSKPNLDPIKQFSDPARRPLMSVNQGAATSSMPVLWTIKTALTDAELVEPLEWLSLFGEPHRPVDVSPHFAPDSTIDLSQKHLREIYDSSLRDWGKNKADDQKVNKPLTVTFNGSECTIGHEVYGRKNFSVDVKMNPSVSLQMRPRDLVDLFAKLIELDVSLCTMLIDTNGLLAVSWDDNLGDYTLYMPAVEAKGGLSKACLSYLKVSN